MPLIPYLGVRRDYGHWKILHASMGRNLPHRGRCYAQADAAVGPHGLAQMTAWANNEGHLGAYWTLWRGKRRVVVGVVSKTERGWHTWSLEYGRRLEY
jgi:hypothetical protein